MWPAHATEQMNIGRFGEQAKKHALRVSRKTTISFSHAYQGRVCPELNYLSGEYINRSNPPIQAATV